MDQFIQIPFQVHNSFYKLLTFLALLVIGGLLSFVLFKGLKLLLKRLRIEVDDKQQSRYRAVFIFMVIMIIANSSLALLEIPRKYYLILDKGMFLILIYAITHFLIMTMSFFKQVLYHRFHLANHLDLQERKIRTQIDFLEKTGTVVITLIAVAIALMSFTKVRELGTSILASAGLAGIILGFAAQKSIGNLLAGLQIAFTQPIRIDDSVIVEGQFGAIEEISLTYVVVRVWDEKRLILPISYFIEKPFINMTRNSSQMLDSVMLYTDHTLPIDKIRLEVKRILDNEGSALWDKRLFVVQVVDTTATNIQVRVLISAANAGSAFDLRCLIREKLIEYIRIHYPECLPKFRYSQEVWSKEREDKQQPNFINL